MHERNDTAGLFVAILIVLLLALGGGGAYLFVERSRAMQAAMEARMKAEQAMLLAKDDAKAQAARAEAERKMALMNEKKLDEGKAATEELLKIELTKAEDARNLDDGELAREREEANSLREELSQVKQELATALKRIAELEANQPPSASGTDNYRDR